MVLLLLLLHLLKVDGIKRADLSNVEEVVHAILSTKQK